MVFILMEVDGFYFDAFCVNPLSLIWFSFWK